MYTVEYLDDGKVIMSVFSGDAWICYEFFDKQTMAKYEQRCYNLPIDLGGSQ